MRSNLLRDNAPGETRTPNLLIRSQSVGWGTAPSTARIAQEAAKQGPKTDSRPHNISHNTPLAVFGGEAE